VVWMTEQQPRHLPKITGTLSAKATPVRIARQNPTNRDLHHTEVVTCNTAANISFAPKVSASMAEWSARLGNDRRLK
jgi:hypothetical protein